MSDAETIPDLDFSGAETTYSTHGMHSFPARFPPQIVDWAIDSFVDESGATILDPMCGSGTTLVESFLQGHNSKGIDKDPLARLMTRVKTTPINISKLERQTELFRRRVVCDINNYRTTQGSHPEYYPSDVDKNLLRQEPLKIEEVQRPQWDNIDYWFFDEVIDELSLINSRIQRIQNKWARELYEIAFSSSIVTKGKTSVVNAHDIAHSRAHKVEPESPPNTLQIFLKSLDEKVKIIKEFTKTINDKDWETAKPVAEVIGDDARDIDLSAESVDLVVTSPPYINALNYVRATKYSLYWLRWPQKSKKDITTEYIGTDRGSTDEFVTRLEHSTQSSTANDQISKIAKNNERMAGIVHKFVDDMLTTIEEIHRVLKSGSECVIIIGDSDIRDVHVETHRILNELAEYTGFKINQTIPRRLDNYKRSLPTDRGDSKDGMNSEFVLQWEKQF